MTTYFDYQNPPPSRDTQADLDRIPDHFARLAQDYDECPEEVTCPACGGTGTSDDLTTCQHCDGEGYQWWLP